MENIKLQLKKIISICNKCADKTTWLASGLIIILLIIFLYNNFFQTISDIKVLLILKGQVAEKVVDMDMWKKINKEIEWKKQLLADDGLKRNPFE